MQNSVQAVEFSNDRFLEVMKLFSKAKLDSSTRDIEKHKFTKKEMTGITADIISLVQKKEDIELMGQVALKIESWKKDTTKPWKMELSQYAREHEDIENIYVGRTDAGNEFLIIVDNSANSSVLSYNEYCFKLAEKYGNIADFMVMDQEEYEGMESFYSEFKKIYQRG